MLLWRFAILAHPAGPDEPWPGKEELEAFAARCEAGSFTSYVGIPYERSSLAVSWGQPTGPSWLDGARSITCMLARLDGEQLTASMRHTGGLTAIATDPLFTVADLPGIVLQTYEAPAGTEHEYSMAMSGDEFRTAIAAGPDQAQEVTWAFWALFATPGSQHPDGSGPVVTDTAAYSISAQTLESPKAASIKLHAAFRETTSIAADPVTLPAEIGDESWAVATPDSELSDYSCLWRMGNLVVAMTADGPAADPAVMLEMAEAMAARAAGAAAPPRPAPPRPARSTTPTRRSSSRSTPVWMRGYPTGRRTSSSSIGSTLQPPYATTAGRSRTARWRACPSTGASTRSR